MKKNQRSAISVVIPSYCGTALLKKHLDSVIAILQPADELIIVDDASPDNNETLEFLTKIFSLKAKKKNRFGAKIYSAQKSDVNYLLAINKETLRFGENTNLGFKLASNKLVLLLNNDVEPESNILDHLLPHFDRNDVFAVTCLEKTGPTNDDWAGKNKLYFERGIFKHNKADNLKTGETAWASGGSSLIDREKFLALGGFDARFKPAYWEDVDLSFQARKRGWQVLFEEKAVVHHFHESTNNTVFGKKKMMRMSWINAKKFTRKNSNLWQKFAYFFWRPYWLVKEIKLFYSRQEILHYLTLLTILVLAIFLRFFKLANVPHGMAWDEAAIGYNGFAIWNVHRDEWLNFMPLSFRSFGDYKAPLAIYLNAISTAIFGLRLWAVRLPFAVAGVMTVLGTYLLGRELFYKKKNGQNWSLFLAFLMAISPWHLHYSRVAFESGLALSLLIWAIYHFYRYLNQKKMIDLFKSSLLACSTLYTYHSAKVTTPLLFLFLIILYWPQLKLKIKSILTLALFTILLLAPLIYDHLWGFGLTRAGSSFLLSNLSFWQKLLLLLKNITSYFSLNFLVKGSSGGELRHSDGLFGVLSYPSLVLVVFSLITLIRSKQLSFNHRRIAYIAGVWVMLGLLPAIIGSEVEHSNRALLALPGYLILAALGAEQLLLATWSSFRGLKVVIILAYIFFTAIYQKHYYLDYAKISAPAFNDGYLETLTYLKNLNKNGVEKILFTNDYQHAYLYTLFVNQLSPIAYHGGILRGFEYSTEINYGDLNRPNTIVVASASDEMMHHEPDKVISGSDGQVRFKIYLPKD